MSKRKWFGSIALFSVLVVILFTLAGASQTVPVLSSNFRLAQAAQPTIPVLPENLSRISWGAVIAGVILALVIQLALNLLGVAIGTTQMDPYDRDAPSAKTLTASAIFWIGLSTIISLVLGGWVAARFAGIPDNVDGILHGLLVWGIVTLATLLLISSTVGRLISGVNILFQRSVDLLGHVTGTLAQGAATVAQAGASAAQGVVERAAQVTQDAVSSGADTVKHELDTHPEVQNAVKEHTASRSAIEEEIRKLLTDAGIEQKQVDGTLDTAKSTVVDAAKDAAQQVQHGDLDQARQTAMTALQAVLDQGQDATQQVDRENVINLLTSRTKLSRDDASKTLDTWQKKLQDARQQSEQVRQQVGGQLEQARTQAEQVQTKVSDKVEEVKAQAAETAREAANEARKSLGKVALALFAALVVGALAAAIGGLLGAPHELPSATVNAAFYLLPWM